MKSSTHLTQTFQDTTVTVTLGKLVFDVVKVKGQGKFMIGKSFILMMEGEVLKVRKETRQSKLYFGPGLPFLLLFY